MFHVAFSFLSSLSLFLSVLLFYLAFPSLFFFSSLCFCFKLFMTHCLPTLNSTYFTTISCLLHNSHLLCSPIYFIDCVCVFYCSYLIHYSHLFVSPFPLTYFMFPPIGFMLSPTSFTIALSCCFCLPVSRFKLHFSSTNYCSHLLQFLHVWVLMSTYFKLVFLLHLPFPFCICVGAQSAICLWLLSFLNW
jgi:hypothetical protein